MHSSTPSGFGDPESRSGKELDQDGPSFSHSHYSAPGAEEHGHLGFRRKASTLGQQRVLKEQVLDSSTEKCFDCFLRGIHDRLAFDVEACV